LIVFFGTAHTLLESDAEELGEDLWAARAFAAGVEVAVAPTGKPWEG